MTPASAVPVPPPRLPAVAVADPLLIARRRAVARPVWWTAIVVGGGLLGVTFGAPFPLAVQVTLCAVAVAAFVLVLALTPWAVIRPGRTWYLGIEPDGVRLPTTLAPDGQVFVPWWAVGRVSVRRFGAVCPVLRIRVRPEARAVLRGFDPLAADKVCRWGFQVMLQGTSMTARQAAELIGRVRPRGQPAGW